MKNKEKKLPSNGSVSELILSAVYFLQKKNGVTAKDITKYICHKRGYKQSQMKTKVKEALERGTKNGIFNLKRGLYKMGDNCRKKLTILKKKVKKKTEANKIPKKIIRSKISMENNEVEDNKLTPINECPKKSSVFRDQIGSHKLSEDIFDRRGRANSYFEPSLLARPSDEEYDYDDEEDDNEDDENSESDESYNPGMFTFTFADDLSHERFPEINMRRAASQTKEKKTCAKGKKRNKSPNRGKGKKQKLLKARKKKCSGEEKKETKRIKYNADNDDYGHEANNYDDEADSEEDQDTACGNSDVEENDNFHFDEEEDEFDYSGEISIEEAKESKFILPPKVKKSEKKEKTESELVKKFKSKKDKVNQKKKEKKEQTKKMDKQRKCKRESSEENAMGENRDDLPTKCEKSLSKSNCLITSSTKLLPSDFKLSIYPNKMVSDMIFSDNNIKFDNQDSSTLLLFGKMKNEPMDQPSNKTKLLDEFEIFCECEPPKRNNLSSSYDFSLTNSTEPIQKRITSEQS